MKILIVTGMEGAEHCASALASILEIPCEVVNGRKAALNSLRHGEYAALVVDETFASYDPKGAELLWENAGLAIPLQINFAIYGAMRLAREIRQALTRREREQAMAHKAAATALESEIKSTVAGLLLHSELALLEREIPPQLAAKLRIMADLAGSLRRQLAPSSRVEIHS